MKGGESRFQEIHDIYRPKILRYLSRLVGEHDAEDLTQEVFVKVSRALDTFRGEAQLSTWIYRIATNTALDRLRTPSFRHLDQKKVSVDSAGADEEDRDVWSGEKVLFIDRQLIRKEMTTPARPSEEGCGRS